MTGAGLFHFLTPKYLFDNVIRDISILFHPVRQIRIQYLSKT